jgi:hypothetical protein
MPKKDTSGNDGKGGRGEFKVLGWWLVVGGRWLVGGWWLVVGGWRLDC